MAFHTLPKTNGYASMLLESVWLSAPYLHNGSVPTLRDFSTARKTVRCCSIGYDVYDYANLGFTTGPEAARPVSSTAPPQGKRNAGHLYGTDLQPADKADLLEFLKTR